MPRTVVERTKLYVTFSEYDAFTEAAKNVELYDHRPYWPQPADIDRYGILVGTKRLVRFLLWLQLMQEGYAFSSPDGPEAQSNRYIHQRLYDLLELVDDDYEGEVDSLLTPCGTPVMRAQIADTPIQDEPIYRGPIRVSGGVVVSDEESSIDDAVWDTFG